VLAIGKAHGDPISLWESQGARETYACLSWCWGEGLPLRTVSNNLSSHKANIPWNQLPLAFQNAVEISRRLGQGYLWIDALCIVQDDKQEWETESSKMAEVYGGAFITICATATANSTQSIFKSLPDSYIQETLGRGTGVVIRTPIAHDTI
jgi:hypothetical protein